MPSQKLSCRWQMPVGNSWVTSFRKCCLGLAAALLLLVPCHANDLVSTFVFQGRSERSFRQHIEHQASLQVEAVREVCQLNPEQTDKLQLVALGDVSRVMQALAVLRQATEELDFSNAQGMQNAAELAQPFRMRVQAGLHGKGSLFAKYLERTLDQSQKERYQQYLAEKVRQRLHLITLNIVADIDERVPLLKAQRERLVELIDKRPVPSGNRLVDVAMGYSRLASIPEKDLRAFLDAAQTKLIFQICEPYTRMREALP